MAPRIAEESLEGRRESSQSNILLFISLYFWSVINVLWTGHKRSKKANNGGNVASNLITILPKMSIEREREGRGWKTWLQSKESLQLHTTSWYSPYDPLTLFTALLPLCFLFLCVSLLYLYIHLLIYPISLHSQRFCGARAKLNFRNFSRNGEKTVWIMTHKITTS